MKSTHHTIIAVVGPTASGKSDLAVEIAKKMGGEIISADSRQVYRGMDIGTGKITTQEMQGIPHHLLDVASPKRQFTVVQYQKLANQTIKKILEKGKVPILCGGTGLYIDAVLEGWQFPHANINKKLRKELEKKSTETLFLELKKLDLSFARRIDKHNRRRLIRALEILQSTQKKIAPLKKKPLPYQVQYVGLFPKWNLLRQKMHNRLESRLKDGMLQEIELLHTKEKLSWKRMESFGLEYKFIAQYLQNKISYEDMKIALERAIFQYAKRQMTWFKRNKKITWFKISSEALQRF